MPTKPAVAQAGVPTRDLELLDYFLSRPEESAHPAAPRQEPKTASPAQPPDNPTVKKLALASVEEEKEEEADPEDPGWSSELEEKPGRRRKGVCFCS